METLTQKELEALHQLRSEKSVAQIADLVGCSRQRVYDWLKANTPQSIESPTYKKLIPLLAGYFLRLSPIAKNNPDCPEICKKLNEWEIKWLKDYIGLSLEKRKELFKKMEKSKASMLIFLSIFQTIIFINTNAFLKNGFPLKRLATR